MTGLVSWRSLEYSIPVRVHVLGIRDVLAVRAVGHKHWEFFIVGFGFRPVDITPHEPSAALQWNRYVLFKDVRKGIVVGAADVSKVVGHFDGISWRIRLT
jgi:hypothetical protein